MKRLARITLIDETIEALHKCQNELSVYTRTNDNITSVMTDLRIERRLLIATIGNEQTIIDYLKNMFSHS
jgi:hypothetical protein